MLRAMIHHAGRLEPIPPGAPLDTALWIDLCAPTPEETAAVAALGADLPTLAEMEEIELSNRLYREDGHEYMTVVLPGQSMTEQPLSGPVTFVLSHERLITLRHHTPRSFDTYADRAGRNSAGCANANRVFLGMVEEVLGRMADLLEGVGRGVDTLSSEVYGSGAAPGKMPDAVLLQGALQRIGRQNDLVDRVRLALLTLERAVSFYGTAMDLRHEGKTLRPLVKGLMREIQSLEVHADFLAQRLSMVTDTTLGMINLSQAATVRIVSVVAVIFLPPTVIASAYGMNFANMPELDWRWGYPMALGLMLASAVLTYLFFKWRKML